MLLLLSSVEPAAPSFSAPSVTNVAQTSVTVSIYIATPALLISRRGLQFSTTPYPERVIDETGLSSTGGIYSLDLTNLTPGNSYFFRFYAENSLGLEYSPWSTFTTLPTAYNVTIGGIDRTTDILANTLQIEDIINDQVNTCTFTLVDRSGNGLPSNDNEIVITSNAGTRIFGGYTTQVEISKEGVPRASYQCTDYTRLLDRLLVHRVYESMTDAAIISDIVSRYCVGSGISATYVVSSATIDKISFNYIQPSQAIRKLCELTGNSWYIDYNKALHYFPLATNVAPFNITSSTSTYSNLKIRNDATQIKNRVYVRGGTKLSDYTTYSTKGDGVKRQFVLPDKPHDVTVTLNGAAKTLGIKNVNTTGYDYYLNFQEKYMEQSSLATLLTSTDTLAITYKYDIPILVAIENTASIIASGVHEFALFDKSISTTQSARDRATAELTDYANSIIEGSFTTTTAGFLSGQYININLSEYGINANYLVQQVITRSLGANTFSYEVSLASAKTLGIVKFLINLLETNKNLVELDQNEVVDELVTITDALLSDSLLDSLVTDSAGLYSTWCTGGETSPSTRARWDLFEWGA